MGTLLFAPRVCTLWQGLSRDASISRGYRPSPRRPAPLASLLLVEPTTSRRPLLEAPQAPAGPKDHAQEHSAGDPPARGRSVPNDPFGMAQAALGATAVAELAGTFQTPAQVLLRGWGGGAAASWQDERAPRGERERDESGLLRPSLSDAY